MLRIKRERAILKALLVVVMTVAITVVICILEGLPVYFLWNWLIPELFGITEITFMQSIGLSLLCHCLFKSHTGKKPKEKATWY